MKDAAQRKRDERQRMRAEGYVLRQFWVHPKDWARVQTYLRRVNTISNRGSPMSVRGAMITVMATELAHAVAADDAHPDGHDISAGMFGTAVSELIRKRVDEYQALGADLAAAEKRIAAIITWLEKNQPNVFRRGIWDAVAASSQSQTEVAP
jgi:hypothetical protein